jgi:alpha-ketoglutarate-dependent taurine dioxygenase
MQVIKHFFPNHSAPLVISPMETSEAAPMDEIVCWLSDERLTLEKALQHTGAILLRDFKAICGAEAFEEIVAAISPEASTDEGSTSPRTQVGKRTYTSTDVPPFIPIELHQERSFNREFPDKIAFFCDVAPEKGGETPIADMRAVYRALPTDVVERFELKGVQLRRRLPTVNVSGNKAIRTWREAFEAHDQTEVDRIATELGWQIRWHHWYLDVGSYVEIENPVCPASITHPMTGERVWFNQAHVLNNNNFWYWAKRYGGLKLWGTALVAPILKQFFYYHHVHGDGSEILNSDFAAIHQAVSSQEIRFPWQQGDVLLLDNILMAHGRCRFEGKRRILVSLMKNSTS